MKRRASPKIKRRASPKTKDRSALACPVLFRKIEKWVDRLPGPAYQSGVEGYEYARKHTLYNLYFTVVGWRPAYIGLDAKSARKFARDFNVVAKVGPYFDEVGRDYAYIVNPKNSRRFEPLFRELEKTYSDDLYNDELYDEGKQVVMDQRTSLIGKILGFESCPPNYSDVYSYGVVFYAKSTRDNNRTEIFAYTCSPKNINTAVDSALKLIAKASPVLSKCGLSLSFEVDFEKR